MCYHVKAKGETCISALWGCWGVLMLHQVAFNSTSATNPSFCFSTFLPHPTPKQLHPLLHVEHQGSQEIEKLRFLYQGHMSHIVFIQA